MLVESVTKNKTFETFAEASGMLKSICHPDRMRIVELLDKDNKLTVTEIYETLGLEQAKTSRHINIMKDKGVLLSIRDGKNMIYYLKNPKMAEVIETIKDCCKEG